MHYSALAKSGRTVLHVDENAYYGGPEATLTLSELVAWSSAASSSTDSRYSAVDLSFSTEDDGGATTSSSPPEELLRSGLARQYNLSLRPTLVTAVSPFVDALVKSGVAKYSGFKLLDAVAIHDGRGAFRRTAATKEDIFNDKSLSLIEKRKLVNFIKFATAGDIDQSVQLTGQRSFPTNAHRAQAKSQDKKTLHLRTSWKANTP